MTNPYQSPAAEDSPPPFPLSRVQRKSLEFYWKHRGQPLTLGRLIWLVLPGWIMMSVVLLPAVGVVTLFNRDGTLYLMFGFLAGIVVRDLAYLQSTIHIWPVMDEVLDWNAVQAKLEKS